MVSRRESLLPPFRCGHARTDDNLKPSVDGFVCRKCAQAAHRRYRINSGYDRKRYLPIKIEKARQKMEELENEARKFGMTELLKSLRHVNQEWDRTIKRAQSAAAAHGGDIGFQEARRGVDER